MNIPVIPTECEARFLNSGIIFFLASLWSRCLSSRCLFLLVVFFLIIFFRLFVFFRLVIFFRLIVFFRLVIFFLLVVFFRLVIFLFFSPFFLFLNPFRLCLLPYFRLVLLSLEKERKMVTFDHISQAMQQLIYLFYKLLQRTFQSLYPYPIF
jgi:hypothetical protein